MFKHPKYLVVSALTVFVLALLLLLIYPYKIATLLPYLMIAIAITISSISILIASHFNSIMRIVTIASLIAIIVSMLPILQLKSATDNIGGLSIALVLVIGLGLSILIDQNKSTFIRSIGKSSLVVYFILFTLNVMLEIQLNIPYLSIVLLAIASITSIIPFFQRREL